VFDFVLFGIGWWVECPLELMLQLFFVCIIAFRDGMMNDYEEAIDALGSTIGKYSSTQEYP